MTKTIYVIMGTTGEYSDRSEWPVAAVEGEDAAKQYIEALQRQYQSIAPSLKKGRWSSREKVKALMTLDPSFEEDYTGTSWYFHEVPLIKARALAATLAVV